MSQNEIAISVQGLRKSYKNVPVLTGVDFEVKMGSIFALLGPNGTGKTTIVKILTTLRHLKNPRQVTDELLKRFGLTDAANRRVSTYSGGMRRRLDIAMSLVAMPIARSAALWGHVLNSLISNTISVAVIVLVALLMGFRSSAGILSWFAVAGILLLFTLALTWIAAIAGLSAKSVDGAIAIAYPIHFLLLISSAFVPTKSMASGVRAFAKNQPVTSIVEVIRSLLSNQPVGNQIWVALAWCSGITLVAYIFAMRVYKKRTS
ncbi:hypothetical protein DBR11_03415 [Pedobacter sp. HMWF019]|uniref:ATP-binding cassette domain-containing protein n=1 Tax=Pedobacter sp. HMWF019 TaxID=2056856 RepID=UPI000D35BA71|nr:ATP-binding cassette domain-containing protein [Pedobacter sp. HMWF019]PTT03026.1 hypothetical protein DBR11_03415 [Pedobacter sp. HMWF019]